MTPSEAHSTIRARVTKPDGIDGVRSQDSNSSRSDPDIKTGSARIHRLSHRADQKDTFNTRH
ncbi:hypothetical protein GCM10009648_31810 [Tsukamurella spumae]